MKDGIGVAQIAGRIWVGVDWGESAHAVAAVDEKRQVLARFKVGTSLEELRRLAGQLRALGTVAGVAIESTDKPVFWFLVSEGFSVYPVNPKLSKNWQGCNSVAGVKSDRRDGLVLALELSRRHESLRVYEAAEDAKAAELAGLCETVDALVQQRTELVLRLRSTLQSYYPAALGFFSDLTAPTAWGFIKKFPRPEALARTHKSTLIRFLKANRVGLKSVWLERIEKHKDAAQWPVSPKCKGREAMALAMVAQLQALAPRIRDCEKEIAALAKTFSKFEQVSSLPGAGSRLAPALTAITAQLAGAPEFLQALRCLSGVAPVQHESGKVERCVIRRRCNKNWRHVLHQFANCSKQYCGWAKAYYQLRREKGDRHGTALRKLSDKWLKIVCKMIEDGTEYDEAKYLKALRESGSPVYARLCG